MVILSSRVVTTLARLVTSLTLASSIGLLGGPVHPTHAAGARHMAAANTRVLALRDFFNIYPNEVEDVSHSARATIAGITYAHAIELDRGIAALSYNTHRYAGYTALALWVGLTDSSDAGSQDTLVISVDGHRWRTIPVQPGAAAIRVVIPFGSATVLRFSVQGEDPASSGLLLAEPTLLTTGTPSHGGPRVLGLRDFFNVYPNEVEDVSHSARATIAGITYAHAIELDRGIAALSYNTHRYAGYTALALWVGLTDSSDAGSQDTLVISVDGHRWRTIPVQPGAAAIRVVIPFGSATVLRFSVQGEDPASSGLLLAEPTLTR